MDRSAAAAATGTTAPAGDADTAAVQQDLEQQHERQQQQQQQPQELVLEPLSSAHLERNAALVERLRGQLILAPLTRGNHLPFRRLCAELGATVTMSEVCVHVLDVLATRPPHLSLILQPV